MLNQVLAKIFGTHHAREMKRLQPIVDLINSYEPAMKTLSDDQLRAKTIEFRERLAKGESLNDLLPEAFAVCREGSCRALGMRHYDVQLIGGMVLHRGSVAEMRTGEGKTLVATLPLYLNALEGKGAHLVTVNDYLAKRDAEWMGRLYGFLGLTTGVIVPNQSDTEKKEAYMCDISYATNNELGFDYLRDNMKFDLADYCQRPLHFAIVDECDSILIDEARTPLIISGPAEDSIDKYAIVNAIIPHLKKEEHFTMEEKTRQVSLTEEGNHKCEELLGVDNLYDPQHIGFMHHIYQALKAHHLYHRDVDYMVSGDEIVIVDEFTGRLMEGRRWSDGLHQAVEAKEKVKIKNENQTLATITFQNYFRMYKKLAGMTGTADTEAVELKKIYNLDVTVIPTNRPIQRIDHQDVVYKNETAKFNAIVNDIKEKQKNGQPILVGTVSIEKSEALSRHLQKFNIPHNVLNAKHHEKEADIVAQAGRFGAVTIATNMAGRGTDIMLGGNPEALARKEIADESKPEFEAVLAKYKAQCEAEKSKVQSAGGLYIVGTERHESRRIDNQLRGRSGRQGDPGESRFFLSLDDDLMRKFNGERVQKIMTMMNVPDDEPIVAGMVTRTIEGAQRRVEGHNFDIRKHLLDFDDVMNRQRQLVYSLRRDVLLGADIGTIVSEMMGEVTSRILDTYADERQKPDQWNLSGLDGALTSYFGVSLNFANNPPANVDDLNQKVVAAIREAFEKQKATLGQYLPQVQKMILLQAIDQRWKEHLQKLDQVRDWINLRAYAQKDPLNEYKKEAYSAFEEMNNLMKADTVEKLMKIQLVPQMEEALQDALEESEPTLDRVKLSGPSEPTGEIDEEASRAAQEALEALRPKQKQKLVFSNGGSDSEPKISRADRRKMERDKKKKTF